jgi:hypothetical protein
MFERVGFSDKWFLEFLEESVKRNCFPPAPVAVSSRTEPESPAIQK